MLSHHATLYITSDPTSVVSSILNDKDGDCEFQFLKYESLNIAAVRLLIEQAYQKPAEASTRVFVVVPEVIPVEAQQALLKILEEPPLTTKFVFVVRPETTLLPTVYSRFFIIKDTESVTLDAAVFTEFLKSTPTARLSVITKESKQKDTTYWQDMAKGLKNFLEEATLPAAEKYYLLQLLVAQQAKGSSKKMIWEDIALRLPVATKSR